MNVFGGITACDAVADGIVKALEILGDAATKPLVVRLDGNNVAEGRRILSRGEPPAGLFWLRPWTPALTRQQSSLTRRNRQQRISRK